MIITRIDAEPYGLRFSRPLATARGRFTHRRGWLLTIADDRGRRGFGDAAPWPGFGAGDVAVTREIGELCGEDAALIGARVETVDDIALLTAGVRTPEARYAIELSLLDLLGQQRGLPIAALLCGEAGTSAACHALVTDGELPGAGTLKLKVGAGSLDTDIRRVAHARAASPPKTVLRLDAGGAWNVEQARHCDDGAGEIRHLPDRATAAARAAPPHVPSCAPSSRSPSTKK